jgi:hypothetical protein
VSLVLLALLSGAPAFLPASSKIADKNVGAPPQRSQKLTAAAEKLLEFEKKLSTDAGEPLDDLLYGDVLNLLDVAVEADADNLHARALRAPILLLLAFDGEAYDICYLLDAEEDANLVISRAAKSNAVDVLSARRVLRKIQHIPPSAIPDPPSVCDEEDDRQRGTRTKSF